MAECIPFWERILLVIVRTELGVGLVLTSSTLIIILSHPRFRRRHHIFPFNLSLADLAGVTLNVIQQVLDESLVGVCISSHDHNVFLNINSRAISTINCIVSRNHFRNVSRRCNVHTFQL